MNQAALLGALAVPILVALLLLLSWHCCCRHAKAHRRKEDRIGSDTSAPSYASTSNYHSYHRPNNVPVPAYFAPGTAVPPATVTRGYQPQAPVFNNPQPRPPHTYDISYRISGQTGPETMPPAPPRIHNPIPRPHLMGYVYPTLPTTATPSRRHSRRRRERGRSAARRAGSVTASSTRSTWSRLPFPFPPYATVEDEGEWMSARSAA